MSKYIFNDKFIDLITEDKFIQIVRSSKEPDVLLQKLLSKNPKNREDIRYAFEFICITKNENKYLNDRDSDEILKKIQSEKNQTSSWHLTWKIAAAILVLVSITSLYIYNQNFKNPIVTYAKVNQNKINHSLIVLSDGSKHILSYNESKIDYTVSDDSIVINKKGEKREKIQNKTTTRKNIMNQVVVPFGQQQNIVLNDGTTVTLNSGSCLIFPSSFTGKIRKVTLIGEGFFHVHKDASHPFIVNTKQIDVKVLGTTFDLSAYKDENVVSAVLVEGSVSVIQKYDDKSSVISPGEGCFYSVNNKKAEIKKVDVSMYTSWKDGVYLFQKESLVDVIKKIKKYYNVNIKTKGIKLSETKISGKLIITGKVEEAIGYISKTVECKVEKNKNGDYIFK